MLSARAPPLYWDRARRASRIRPSQNLNLADAGQARQFILHLQRGVVTHIQRVVFTAGRNRCTTSVSVGDRFWVVIPKRRTSSSRRAWPAIPGFAPDLCLIRVGTRTEGDGGRQHAVGSGDGISCTSFSTPLIASSSGRRHGLSDHFRVGAGYPRAPARWRHDRQDIR